MQYFVLADDGNEYGPVDYNGLKQWAEQNRVQRTSKVRNATNGMVMAASNHPELSDLFPMPSPGANLTAGGAYVPPNSAPSQNPWATPTNPDGTPVHAPGQNPHFGSMYAMSAQDEGYKEMWICIGLGAATVAIGMTIGFLSIMLGIYAIQRAVAAHQTGEKGSLIGLIVTIILVVIGIGYRFVVGSMLARQGTL
jgi:hypothetical protein